MYNLKIKILIIPMPYGFLMYLSSTLNSIVRSNVISRILEHYHGAYTYHRLLSLRGSPLPTWPLQTLDQSCLVLLSLRCKSHGPQPQEPAQWGLQWASLLLHLLHDSLTLTPGTPGHWGNLLLTAASSPGHKKSLTDYTCYTKCN